MLNHATPDQRDRTARRSPTRQSADPDAGCTSKQPQRQGFSSRSPVSGARRAGGTPPGQGGQIPTTGGGSASGAHLIWWSDQKPGFSDVDTRCMTRFFSIVRNPCLSHGASTVYSQRRVSSLLPTILSPRVVGFLCADRAQDTSAARPHLRNHLTHAARHTPVPTLRAPRTQPRSTKNRGIPMHGSVARPVRQSAPDVRPSCVQCCLERPTGSSCSAQPPASRAARHWCAAPRARPVRATPMRRTRRRASAGRAHQ